MTVAWPMTIPRHEVHASFGGHRLARIMGYRAQSPGPVSSVLDRLGDAEPAVRHVASYVDATRPTPIQPADGPVAVHILWTVPGNWTEVGVGGDHPGFPDMIGHEVQAGETVLVPAGSRYQIGADIVAFVFAAPPAAAPGEAGPSRSGNAPTHGLNLFSDYNRRTICAAQGDLLLERWKLTQPLDLPLRDDRWHYLTNLVEPVAMTWQGGLEVLQRTESRFLPAGMERITLVPDGLGYVLIGTVPNLRRDVVAPLRRAGYERAAIAALGVPREYLV